MLDWRRAIQLLAETVREIGILVVVFVPVDYALASVSSMPSLFNEFKHGVVVVRYLVRQNMNLGLVYWYDRYRLQDFALGIDTLNKIDMTAGVLLLDNAYRPYTSSTLTLRMTYLW